MLAEYFQCSPSQWIKGAFPCGYSGRGVKMTTHLHLVPRSRMRGATLQYAFVAWCLVKHRDNFTSTFYPNRPTEYLKE